MLQLDANYWENRYENNTTGWDIGYASYPLAHYFDQLQDKSLRILVPGGGNGYEAAYLFDKGFANVYLLDWAHMPLENFAAKYPHFPKNHLLNADFFQHEDTYDLIVEQTFFCALSPSLRPNYAQKMHELLSPKGKLVGLWFKHALDANGNPPYGGSKDEYLTYLRPFFTTKIFEDCYNSIPPRQGNELFGVFRKK
ncbi:MAG: SAM-dependent methyltransferase [Chitinophagales bacterium]|nr:SAM-dependent methyltransferase [Bacteroidota bacterium]